MGKNGGTPDSERITYLEEEVKALRKQAESLAGQVLGGAAILCLPLPRGRRLEIAFRQMENLPNGFLGAIVRRYVAESRTSGLSLDDMLGPVVAALGLERGGRSSEQSNCARRTGTMRLCGGKKWQGHPCEQYAGTP